MPAGKIIDQTRNDRIVRCIRGWFKRVMLKGELSYRRGVASGVPKGLIIEPTLFNVFVSQLGSGARSIAMKSADNIRLEVEYC